MKNCIKCDIFLIPNGNWKENSQKNHTYYCNYCFSSYQGNWHNKNRNRLNKLARDRTLKLKIETINSYGGKCACCAEAGVWFLGIDHINNDGNIERYKYNRSGFKLYSYLKSQGFPKDKYQLLCHNCNFAKGHMGKGICPHKEIKNELYISGWP